MGSAKLSDSTPAGTIRRARCARTFLTDEGEKVAEELRRIRDSVREAVDGERRAEEVLGPPPAVREPVAPPPLAEPPPFALAAARPDVSAINALWDVRQAPPSGGLKGRLVRLVRRAIAPFVESQVAFNARQVQLDNDLLAYVDARLEATHRHYDGVLGAYGRHLQDVDKRHLILQEELVKHVHDLVRRIDLVLSESERGRLSLEFALRDLRARLMETLPGDAAAPKGPRA